MQSANHVSILAECPIVESFRVSQVAGLFDLPAAKSSRFEATVEVPGMEEEWKIGLIVGPSGSGKSLLAKAAFPSKVYGGAHWPADRAVVDCFGDIGIKELTGMLTAVGFSSPPAWLRPFAVLSNGEKFRCELARALLEAPDVLVYDEFTSVVDRTVAKVGSVAIAKAIRAGRVPGRFVAVACHYDIAEWLEPDWIVDMAGRTLARGLVRRRPIEFNLVACHKSAWGVFAHHHYLNGNLPMVCRCYAVMHESHAVGFCCLSPVAGFKNYWNISRIVILPDYQGIGLGSRLRDACAELVAGQGKRVGIVTSHPAMIASCKNSPRWRCIAVSKRGNTRDGGDLSKQSRGKGAVRSYGRATCSFKYITTLANPAGISPVGLSPTPTARGAD